MMIPHSRMLSIAYCEQVGVNRQHGIGLSGEINLRYSFTGISHISHKKPCTVLKALLFFRIPIFILRQRCVVRAFSLYFCIFLLLYHIELSQAVEKIPLTFLH